MRRILVAIALFAGLPTAQAGPRLKHSIEACADPSRPSRVEQKVARRLKARPCDADCLKKLLSELNPPLRRCYNPKRPPEIWEKCARHMRGKPYFRATTTGKAGAIEVRQVLNTYCNASGNLRLSIERKGSRLRLIERFTAKDVTKCVCPLDIKATIEGLPPGEYSLEVVFDNRFAKRREVLQKAEGLRIGKPK